MKSEFLNSKSRNQYGEKNVEIPGGPSPVNVQPIHWPFAEKYADKKHLNCCYYDSAVHFEFEGIEVATIIFLLALKNLKKNIFELVILPSMVNS